MKALLIAGDGRFFLDEVLKFKKFLQKGAGIADVQVMMTGYMTLNRVWTRLRKALDPDRANGPLLLLYCGHGAETGWSVSFCKVVLYRLLITDLLKNYPEPIVFVNDCCYAATPIKYFEQCGILPEKMSFIAAINDKETVESYLVSRVQRSWEGAKAHRPSRHLVTVIGTDTPTRNEERLSPEVRWGAELDHLFYSRFPRSPKKNRLRKEPFVATIDSTDFVIKATSSEIAD
ncbi:MAG TPA: hypothetical protein VNG29_03155 [Candidatus Paceibacterota bacterium]|nr:hypothetical protein [Candidatus Paceibacterota bacterium]